MKNHTFWLAAYAGAAVAELIGEISGNSVLVYATKPLLMPLLGVWFYFSTRGSRHFFRLAILSGLAFSTLGDVLLMLAHDARGPLFFLLGLGAFLITHLFYTGGLIIADGKRRHFPSL